MTQRKSSVQRESAQSEHVHPDSESQSAKGSNSLLAGVIGVGHMGRHHTRVYNELPNVTLVGVHDVNQSQASDAAEEYGTDVFTLAELLARVEVVSVAVPTEYHYEVVNQCLKTGTHVLVEKPFVEDPARGRELAMRAQQSDLTIQVGHIERFNPVTRVLADIVPDLDVIAIDVERLGPPVDRDGEDTVVMDLMIHDIDIILSLIGADIDSVSAMAYDRQHVTAQFSVGESIASLTASRRTEQKVRRLSITAKSCRVNVDFIDQTIEIHRRSLPEYIESDGNIRYRQESVVERPMVNNGEPLKGEITAFLDAVRDGTEPVVSASDALDALSVVRQIESIAFAQSTEAKLQ